LSLTAMAQQVEEAQQWSTAVKDAAAVIQSKEAQLQLVTDYCRHTQRAKTTMERQTAQLDAVKCPDQSSSKEAEQLSSLQRSMEESRTVLGELLVTYTKLCPHLSQSERATAQNKQRNLQEKWRGLERAVERTLHHT
uniref:Si:dkeyp-77c8.3 n=1 Tax=Seriola dumerili TaxID=41447 RepID=A0A3B4TNG0_SERDU